MSDDLPLEIQEQILKKLPIKSLIQVRSVSKAWKSLIDTPSFITHYTNQRQHLLVRYDHHYVFDPEYVSLVDADNESFPKQRASLTPPFLVNMLKRSTIVGSSHGLLCLYDYSSDVSDSPRMTTAVIWNPSIRKAVAVVVPNVADFREGYTTHLVFGVCPETSDPKIVKITQIDRWSNMEMESVTCIPWQVEVFALSDGRWRSPCKNLPRESIQFDGRQGVDGFVYWLATDRSAMDAEFESYNLIISFSLTSEEFREVKLPDSLVYYRSMCDLSIGNLRESLVVLEYDQDEGGNIFVVWMMEDGVLNSFAKLFTISPPDAIIVRVLEFRKRGEAVIEVVENHRDPLDDTLSLVVYEPNSKHVTNLGIDGIGSFNVYSYMETLLLLDQPDLMVYNDNSKL